ncbi:outer-membrane efflux lipo domain protein [Salmonella enterica subsp. enterica serovar Reading]|uniref:Outer-membrane efflux lipo domain protein n=1 Tax=Salmonella enterica subsp. enterica serovar Heidelberg TaxID=611 RepID=A0A5Z6G8G7_SALET|nr:outer-membrane efflux lipo domain protein [Escherichia coli]EAX8819014.1 outer-membrane efflux lipo domain protein [Salmonella enterica]EBF3494491.1 outer-membrane efflux lipo domain protein [Salmonella enterica subsp. enterica serovar Reading]ECS3500036.1 outer-membrane efflux lipo domain protein [Salmonella enterica subsp. enterica serovar Heidelberg]EDM8459234.1 outer-membrane efflux lipo domain protein [Salmonella enterica subsp. enterica serovar Agona]
MLPGWLLRSFYFAHDRYQRITAKMTTLSLSCHPTNGVHSVK